ncbi:pyridoxal-phosphate dependent enzyme [Streptomyces sp. SBC-4]|nr:pyridoxal-phosphate dependent enzyme [Streptomyces sp. SBC-4]MDV5142875.1 pyridoxal-phosphate dependent enzyme [Streptomyces sp. SBC-4]
MARILIGTEWAPDRWPVAVASWHTNEGGPTGLHGPSSIQRATTGKVARAWVIPADAPAPKLEGVRALGAKVVTYRRGADDRDALVTERAEREGLAVVPSANSRHIMAGAGTAALELLTDHPEIETLVVPVGGGGPAAGSAVIAKYLNPGIRVYGVESEEGADTLLSLRCGQRIALPEAPSTIADGLGHASPAPMTWAVNSRRLDGIVTVSDRDIIAAMAFAFRHLKIVAEPSGAVALAAVLTGAVPHESGTIGIMISGGGVDLPTFHRLISATPHRKAPAHA